ncbi:hypothetical protein BC830DRAFT_1154792 [Chytriomyces sp. MP71]|nr:hypothetical protein BC830DRAFT_1154792 [Chytriomyces sp. MP71]
MTCCFSTTTNNPSQWKAWLNASIVLSDTVSPGHQDYLSITFTPPPTGFFSFDAPVILGAKSNTPAPCRPVNASGNAWVCAAYGTSSNLGFDFLIDVASALPPGTMPSISQMLLFSSNSTSLDDTMNETGRQVPVLVCSNPPDGVSKCPPLPTSPVLPAGGASLSPSNHSTSSGGLSPSTVSLIVIVVVATLVAIAVVVFFRGRHKGTFTKMFAQWQANSNVPRGSQPAPVQQFSETVPSMSMSTTQPSVPSSSVKLSQDLCSAAAMTRIEPSKASTLPLNFGGKRAAINPLAYRGSLQRNGSRHQQQHSKHLTVNRASSPSESVSTSVFSGVGITSPER